MEKEERELQEHYTRQGKIIKKFEKKMGWVFTHDLIGNLGACEWKSNGTRDHRYQKRTHSIMIFMKGKRGCTILCQYCYLIWLGNCLRDLEKAGFSKEDIHRIVLSPPRQHYENRGGYLDHILLSMHQGVKKCKKCFVMRDKEEQNRLDKINYG